MSELARIADDYLQLRRSLGHKLDEAGRLLPRFVAYLDAVGVEVVTVEAALAWAQQPDAAPGSIVWARRMMVVRGFARHLAGVDPRTQVPPVGLLPHPHRQRRVPYIYSASDITALMSQTKRCIPNPLRAAMFETLIGLLAVTGMRIGEAIRLDRADVNWADATITIVATKFNESRQLPLQASTLDALAAYASRRDQLLRCPQTPSFVSLAGTRLLYPDIRHTFTRLIDTSGVGAAGATRPRIHDMRH
jgi:integrase